MNNHTPIKLIKRATRERLERDAAGSSDSELAAHEKASMLAATVKEWISELRQKRLQQHLESEQLPGRPLPR